MLKIKIKTPKPFCRTPIKPVVRHKIDTKYQRHSKHRKSDYAYA